MMKKLTSIIGISGLIIFSLIRQSVMATPLLSPKSTVIYKYFDANGVLHLTNKPPPNNNDEVLYARSYLIQPHHSSSILLPIFPQALKKRDKYNDYVPLIEAVADSVGLSPALLQAIVQVESAYNSNAVSKKGAVGLMQLMPATAKRYGVIDRTDPIANLIGGAQYFRDLLTMFNEELSLALAAYNAGEATVKRYSNTIPPYQETRNYVKKVKKLYYQYLKNQ